MAGIKSTPVVLVTGIAAFAGGLCLFKDWYCSDIYNQKIRADGKTVIITGANSGIGKETAWEFAKRGAKVFMACRDLTKCEEARKQIVLETENKYVYCRKCDLASLQSVTDFVKRFKSEEKELHILVNNAGLMEVEKSKTNDGFEKHLGVNHLGHFLLTNLLLDNLKNTPSSRVVIVSSVCHKKGNINKEDLNLEQSYDAAKAYNQSKLANMLFGRELALKLLESKVAVSIVDPRLTETALTRHMPMTNSITSYLIYPLFWPFIQSPRIGAQGIVFAALDHKARKSAGDYFVNMKVEQPSETAQDYELSSWLWKVSEKWTKLNERREEVARTLAA